MKKIILMGTVCLLVNYVVNAQVAHAQFGLKAGVNFANIHVKDAEGYDSRTGFYVGGLAHVHITRYFALQPEVIYSTQGAEIGSLKRKQDYINVPVLAQYMVNNGFRLQTGPQVGFLTSAKNKTGDVEVDIKDQLNTVDFAWAFGASYLSKTGLGLDARYNLGISNINDNESAKATNRVWQVGAFYQFSH
jgi:Outer membrane protein beta-barrel domain